MNQLSFSEYDSRQNRIYIDSNYHQQQQTNSICGNPRSISSVSSTNSSTYCTRASVTSSESSTSSMSNMSNMSNNSTYIHDERDDDVAAPCDGDPFWDYYITTSSISRANMFELTSVMKFISAQHVIKYFIQDWLQNKIKPKDIPFLGLDHKISSKNNNTKPKLLNAKSFTMSKSGTYKFDARKHEGSYSLYSIYSNTNDNHCNDLNLHSCALTKFIQKSLKSNNNKNNSATSKHPNYFNIPLLIILYHNNNNNNMKHNIKLNMNDIGTNIFSFLDQNTFLKASIVSRAWFYCSRYSKSRSHIKLKLLNVLKHFTKPKYLLNSIIKNNNIVCFNHQNQNHNHNDNEHENGNSDTDNDEDDNENDPLLSCIKTKDDNYNDEKMTGDHDDDDDFINFSSFFISRTKKCLLFSSVCVLQIDLTILCNNSLIYFIDDKLYDEYWEIILILFGISSLSIIDVILIDPHILLLSHVLKNIKYKNKSYINIKQLKFPSIGFRAKKGNKLYNSKCIKSLSFKCKSLSTNQLIKILNTHFKNFYYPSHHNNHNTISNNIKKYKYYKYYKSLDSYILCRKIIQKPLIYDLTHALDPINNLHCCESLIMCDTRCAKKEFELFLLNNCETLSNLEMIFTDFCLASNYKSKSNTILRITNYLNGIFDGILNYLNESIDNNKCLGLHSLAISFPNKFNAENICGFFNLFKIFENKYCPINKLFLNISNLNQLNWKKIFQSQYIESLHLKQIIYFDSFFDYFSKLWSNCLVHLDLTLSFQLNSNSSSKPIKKLFLYLSKCNKLQYLSLNLMQKTPLSLKTNCDYVIEPIFDIWWLYHFITSKNIKKTIKSLKLTFNEMSTKKFENNRKLTRKFENYGEILRISHKFKIEIEQLIMSWFSYCPYLIEIIMIRKFSHFSNNNNNNNNTKKYNNFNISCFKNNQNNDDNIVVNDHDLALFKIKKWKIGNIYKGDVVGDIDKLLMPEIPIR